MEIYPQNDNPSEQTAYLIRFEQLPETGFYESAVAQAALANLCASQVIHGAPAEALAKLAIMCGNAGSFSKGQEQEDALNNNDHPAPKEVAITQDDLHVLQYALLRYSADTEKATAALMPFNPMQPRLIPIRILEGCYARSMSERLNDTTDTEGRSKTAARFNGAMPRTVATGFQPE